MINPVGQVPDLPIPTTPGTKIHDAARQFETLLLTQLLKTSREAGGSGWLGTGDDQSGAMGMELAEQQFAQMLASSGGLGISKLIAAGLTPTDAGK